MVGLGRMGSNMAERLRRGGHEVIGYDLSAPERDVDSLPGLVEALERPRAVWSMVPAGPPTEATVAELAEVLTPGDLVVDGGNSRFSDSVRRGELLAAREIGFVDVGVSGGVWGLENGYALMVGGSAADVDRIMPVLQVLSPGERGLAHVGPVGAGHFAKMVHNAVEYGMMEALAEGYELLAASELGIDVPAAIGSWQEGSVVRSWLLDLLVQALADDPDLSAIRGYAADSGEGRWAVEEAVRLAVPAPVTASALFARFASRQDDSPGMRVIAALRNQFGGHALVRPPGDDALLGHVTGDAVDEAER
jgi:6-phosphogluconate dehydrogenase